MNILYVAKFRPFYSTANYVTSAFHALGHKVIRHSVHKYLSATQYRQQNIHLVLLSKPVARGTHQFIQWAKARNIPTATWWWDLYFRIRRPLPYYQTDHVFTTDGGNRPHFSKFHIKPITLRQGVDAVDATFLPPVNPIYDVGFVGNWGVGYHPTRNRLVKHLAKKYCNRFIAIRNTRGKSLNRALATVKVIVGDSFPSHNYWSNRIYEITGRGGFFMHPITEGLDTEYIPFQEYVPYQREDYQNLFDMIDYYIENDKEREQIRLDGQLRTAANYTYSHRCQKLLEYL